MKKTVLLCGLALFCLRAALPQERFRKSPPVPEPLEKLQLPVIESARLSNGLTVAVSYRQGQPFISLELIILVGESSSPEELPGLATFTAKMLSHGTPVVSAAELEERIEFIGGNFSTEVSPDYSRFSFIFLDEYLDEALEVLSQMVLQPDFGDREIVALKRTQYYDMVEEQRDPEIVSRRQLLRLLFDQHPYLKFLYSEDIIKNYSRKPIQDFYETYYRPNNAILVLAGNLNLTTASRIVSHYLNTWKKKEVQRPLFPYPKPNEDDRVCFVELPQARDATLLVGNVIFPWGDPDYFAFAVLNQVLGGTLNSRLFLNLRESKEYAYNAFSDFELFRSCGVYSIRARVVPSACFSASQEILNEIQRIAEEKVSTFELEQAKAYLIGNFPFQLSRLDLLAARVAQRMAFSLGDDYWNGFYENIQLIDANKVFEVAQKYLLPRPVVVIVGDPDVLGDYLRRDFDRLEIYNSKGELRYTQTKGVIE
jgi:zinc protease